MRLSKTVTVALFGSSAVGKTAAANILGSRYGVSVRHCGEIAKSEARTIRCSIDQLPIDVHNRIDEATRRTVADPHDSWLVVEGRYLDLVLKTSPDVLLIALTCTRPIRAARRSTDLAAVIADDEADNLFRARLQERTAARSPALTIDTSTLTEQQTVDAIIEEIRATSDAL